MDGIVECAMDWQSSSSGVGTPPPVQGLLAAPPPPPPQHPAPPPAPPVDGWRVSSSSYFSSARMASYSSSTKAPGTGIRVVARPATGTAGRREPHLLLVFPFGGSNWHLQGSSRLHGRCSRRPKPNPAGSLLWEMTCWPCSCVELCNQPNNSQFTCKTWHPNTKDMKICRTTKQK